MYPDIPRQKKTLDLEAIQNELMPVTQNRSREHASSHHVSCVFLDATGDKNWLDLVIKSFVGLHFISTMTIDVQEATYVATIASKLILTIQP